MTTADKPILGVLHRTQIHARGLTDETIERAGIYTESNRDMLAALIGWKKYPAKMGPAIVLPFIDDQGHNGYCQIRPNFPPKDKKDGKPKKYISPAGKPQPYFPFGVVKGLADTTAETLITEGVFKALAIVQTGWLAIGLTGVDNFTPKGRMSFLPALERIEWKGRPVFFAYDSDIRRNPHVQAAESKFAALLKDRGAIVKVLRIPDGPSDEKGEPTKLGIDDYLAIQPDPKKAMRDLLNAAEDAQPPEPGSLKASAGEIDAVPEAADFLDTTKVDDVPRLLFWRGAFHSYIQGAYCETPISDVRGALIDHLDTFYCKISSGCTNNVMDGLKAKARIAHRIEPPAWIGEETPPAWKPQEILATKKALIHLPSFAENKDVFAMPATPRFFTQNALDYEFDPDAKEPAEWLNFLSEYLWKNDPQSILMLQEWFGYCLLPDTSQEKILMLIGPPRSGKGTIARVLGRLIGKENVCGPTLSSLGGPFGLQPLLGKSLAIISDARLGNRTDSIVVTERLLAISGEDALTVDRKCTESVTGKLPTRLMFLSNELPKLRDSSGALSNRMIILKLTESFLGREDTTLTDRLLGELPGILLWATTGRIRIQQQGHFTQPDTSKEMAQELYDLSSPVGAFIRECCETGDNCQIPKKVLYDKYAEWCKSKGQEEIEDDATFGRNLRAALPTLGSSQPRILGVQIRHYTRIQLATRKSESQSEAG